MQIHIEDSAHELYGSDFDSVLTRNLVDSISHSYLVYVRRTVIIMSDT